MIQKRRFGSPPAALGSCLLGLLFWLVVIVVRWGYLGGREVHSGMAVEIILISAATVIPCYIGTLFGVFLAAWSLERYGRSAYLAYVGLTLCGSASILVGYVMLRVVLE